jgi:hypothetical protein
MVLAKLILTFAFASYFDDVRHLTCQKDMPQMRLKIQSIEENIVPYLAGKPKSEILAKLDLLEREMMFITLVKPDALQSKVDYANMYADCAKLHQDFLKSPAKKNLDAWTSCVEHNYGRAETPEVYTFLRDCYQRISR